MLGAKGLYAPLFMLVGIGIGDAFDVTGRRRRVKLFCQRPQLLLPLLYKSNSIGSICEFL